MTEAAAVALLIVLAAWWIKRAGRRITQDALRYPQYDRFTQGGRGTL